MKDLLMILFLGVLLGLGLIAGLNHIQAKTCPECKGSKIDKLFEKGE